MNKTVLITGATSGIGKETALLLASKGFLVYGTARNVEGKNLPFRLLPMDVRNETSIKEAIQQILTEVGRIDILINNAGVGITGAVEELPAEQLHNVFATNLYGAIAVIQQVLPAMRAQGSGRIINIASIAGYMGLPFRGAYSASKGALLLMSEALRMEVKQFGIEVTTISPGGDPKEMAEKILKIINTKHPKVHYKQGSFLQKFSIVLKRLLPSKSYEKMLMKHYSLN